MDIERQVRRLPVQDLDAVDGDRAWFAFDFLTAAGQLIELGALDLDRGNHRRYLHEGTAEMRERLFDLR